jgi:hypothetical protein
MGLVALWVFLNPASKARHIAPWLRRMGTPKGPLNDRESSLAGCFARLGRN